MGKRELLLVVVFLVLGVGVYQVTAPAAEPGAPGFSVARLVQFAKAHFGGSPLRRTVERTATLTAGTALTRLTLHGLRGSVTVEASDRADVLVTAQLMLSGLDEADLVQQDKGTRLEVKAEGSDAHVAVTTADATRRPRYELHISVPRALTLRVDGGRGRVEAIGVAAVEFSGYRGDVRTDGVTGPVTGDIRDGRAEFGAGATLKLETKNVLLRADDAASVTLTAERGTIDLVDPTGPVTIDQNYARMDIRGSGGPVTIRGDGGTVTVREIAHPLRIAASRLTVTADLETPVETTIDNENDTIELTLPRSGGVRLDASVTDGQLRLPAGLAAAATDDRQSISTTVNGDGPTVKVTLQGGELRIRSRAQPGT